MIRSLLGVGAAALVLTGCGRSDPDLNQTGPRPDLPDVRQTLVPPMKIAKPIGWGDQVPTVPAGFTVTALATDLQIPRQMLVLPNGDILVAEGRGGGAPARRPKDVIAGSIKKKGNTQVASGNRVTLLRDVDNDGRAEVRTVFIDNLDAPYGLAFVDGSIYVANQGALVRFAYQDGQTRITAATNEVSKVPSAINDPWS
jgi:glucose/arabinose dehydrogenase